MHRLSTYVTNGTVRGTARSIGHRQSCTDSRHPSFGRAAVQWLMMKLRGISFLLIIQRLYALTAKSMDSRFRGNDERCGNRRRFVALGLMFLLVVMASLGSVASSA